MDEGREFEEEVRKVARLLWPKDPGAGAVKVDGQERDGVFISEECVHAIECTISRGQQKAIDDGKKLLKLLPKLRRMFSDKAVKGWFVTKHEPTADQRSTIKSYGHDISAVSYDVFRCKLIDAKHYLVCRKDYPFGSARDPETGNADKRANYVTMDLCDESGNLWSLPIIAEQLINCRRLILIGDYGAGKSTTLREIFYTLSSDYFNNKTIFFPILLNLRDHHGQRNAAEALERHARNIGYPNPHHLVRAWRAGYAILLLDGFDELGSPGWTGIPKRLKDLRYQSMGLIREFAADTPAHVGLIIAGRAHYFDHEKELRRSIGLLGEVHCLSLSDFTEDQVAIYLEKRGWKGEIPLWLPSRPLLIGYLAAKGVLQQTIGDDPKLTPAEGWDILLERVCEREAAIDVGISGDSVRKVIERLASRARYYYQGLGPLSPGEIAETFREVSGYEPDEQALILLQRLPGLAVSDPEDGSRYFIDRDMVDIARVGDLINFIRAPYEEIYLPFNKWQCAIGQLGRNLAARKCRQVAYTAKQISNAAWHAKEKMQATYLASDLVQIILEIGETYFGHNLILDDILLEHVFLYRTIGDLSKIMFKECAFQQIEIDSEIKPEYCPKFKICLIGTIIGRVSKHDLPGDVFDNQCEFEEFSEEMTTTKEILDSSLPIPLKVALSILKKLYLQAGSGRRQSALFRGLDHREKRYVENTLSILRQEGLVFESEASSEPIWLPVRRNYSRVRQIISAPISSQDPIIRKLNDMN
jgi:hypothetical protein